MPNVARIRLFHAGICYVHRIEAAALAGGPPRIVPVETMASLEDVQ